MAACVLAHLQSISIARLCWALLSRCLKVYSPFMLGFLATSGDQGLKPYKCPGTAGHNGC